MYDSGVNTFGDYTVLSSGVPSTTPTRSAHGVAICLYQQATAAWREAGPTWEAVSERIISCRLSAHPVNVTLISIYSPINPQSAQKSTADAADVFYIDLQRTLDKTPTNDMILIMGDFNARIGKQQHQTISSVVGPHAVDHLNENGKRLVDFCSHNDFIITNTFFQHKAVHQTSWMHPGNKKWHMLDYTLVNRKFRSSVEDVRVLRSCAGAIGTDHHLLRTKLKFHLKSRRKKNTARRARRLDKKKLQDPSRRQAFQVAISNASPQAPPQATSNDKYADLVATIKDLSEQHFGQDENNVKRKRWLNDEVLDIVNKKVAAYLEWQNHRSSRHERKYHKQYCLLRKLAKKATEARQVEYWDELSLEIEQAIDQKDPATAYAMLRRLRGGRAKIEDMPIFDSQGNLLTNSNDRLNRWREYFDGLLNVPTTVQPTTISNIYIPPIPREEEDRQNNPPTLAELEQAIGQMKSGKAAGIDDITADVLKAGGHVLAKRILLLFLDVWENEDEMEEWSTAILIRLFKNKGDKRTVGTIEESLSFPSPVRSSHE